MPKYRIIRECRVEYSEAYTVEAENEDQAMDLFYDDAADFEEGSEEVGDIVDVVDTRVEPYQEP